MFMTLVQKVKQILHSAFLLLGIELHKMPKVPYKFFEIDDGFNSLYRLAQNETQMSKSDSQSRRERHYTLIQLLERVIHLDGDVV